MRPYLYLLLVLAGSMVVAMFLWIIVVKFAR